LVKKKCKNLEEKLHDEKLQINVEVGGVGEEKVQKPGGKIAR